MYCQCLPLFDAIQNAYDNKWEAILLSHIDILLKQRGGGQRKIKQLKKFHGLKNLNHDFLIVGFYQSLRPSFKTAFDAVGLLTSLALSTFHFFRFHLPLEMSCTAPASPPTAWSLSQCFVQLNPFPSALGSNSRAWHASSSFSTIV